MDLALQVNNMGYFIIGFLSGGFLGFFIAAMLSYSNNKDNK